MKKSLSLWLFTALALMITLFPSPSVATNLRAGPIITPTNVIRLQQALILSYLLRNDSLFAASNVRSMFTVRDLQTGQIVFENETVTPFIAAYTAFVVQSQMAWIPELAGRYRASVDIVYDDDVIPGDNSRSIDFQVQAPPPGAYDIIRYSVLYPFVAPMSQWGSFRLSLEPATVMRWVNVVAWRNDSIPTWVAENLPVPPSTKQLTYDYDVDWTSAGIVAGEPKDSVTVSVTVTDTTWNALTTELLKQGFIVQHDTFAVGTDDEPVQPGMSPPGTPTRTPLARTPVLRETILRDTVPNIDLDSTVHNGTTEPGYAGDFNACVPTACANSMQWLENFEEALPQTVAIREKLTLISAFCMRERSEGVSPIEFVRAKLHYADSLKVPLRIKFQANGRWIKKDSSTIASPIGRFGHTAANQSSGDSGRVSIDWIAQEIKDNEDVEISFKYYDTVSNQIKGGHCVNVVGVITDNDRLRGLWYQDDKNQIAPGGTDVPRYVSVDDVVDPRGPVIYNNQIGRRRFIHAAFSESYDPTVTFNEDPGSVGQSNRPIPTLHASVNDGVLFVASMPELTGASVMQLIDIAGRMVAEFNIGSGERIIEKDLRALGLVRGTYFLSLTEGSSVIATGAFQY